MDRVCTGERRVRRDQGLTSLTEEPDIEELKGASVAQDRPAHRRSDEADNGRPLALLVPVGEP